MIIVEGLDNTGKTTLVKQLADAFPQLKIRPSIGNKHDPAAIAQQAWQEAYYAQHHTISDRSRIISEWVYNPILRARPTAFSFDRWMKHLAGFAQGQHLVIYAVRHLEEIRESFQHKDQLEGVYDNLDLLNRRYSQVIAMLKLLFELQPHPVSTIDTYFFADDYSRTFIMNEVQRYLTSAKKEYL